MTKQSFFTITLGFILSFFNIGNSYAQNTVIVFPPPKPIIQWIPDQKSHINRLTLAYWQGQVNWEKGISAVYYLLSEIELPVITRGDTTRIRYMFDNTRHHR